MQIQMRFEFVSQSRLQNRKTNIWLIEARTTVPINLKDNATIPHFV